MLWASDTEKLLLFWVAIVLSDCNLTAAAPQRHFGPGAGRKTRDRAGNVPPKIWGGRKIEMSVQRGGCMRHGQSQNVHQEKCRDAT